MAFRNIRCFCKSNFNWFREYFLGCICKVLIVNIFQITLMVDGEDNVGRTLSWHAIFCWGCFPNTSDPFNRFWRDFSNSIYWWWPLLDELFWTLLELMNNRGIATWFKHSLVCVSCDYFWWQFSSSFQHLNLAFEWWL